MEPVVKPYYEFGTIEDDYPGGKEGMLRSAAWAFEYTAPRWADMTFERRRIADQTVVVWRAWPEDDGVDAATAVHAVYVPRPMPS